MNHCDRHVVKMLTEYSQLLSMAVWMRDPKQAAYLQDFGFIMNSPRPDGSLPTHYQHPCTLWTATSAENFEWLRTMAMHLADEYLHRYGSRHNPPREHRSFTHCLRHLRTPASGKFPHKGFTEPFQAMPDEFRGPDVVQAYRRLYGIGKIRIITYKHRVAPVWMHNYLTLAQLPTYRQPDV